MIINLIVISICLISGLIFWDKKGSDVNDPIIRKRYIVFISVILILQSGLRNIAVGADTYTYFLIFESVKKMSWSDIYTQIVAFYGLGIGKDPGYLAFQKIIQYVIPNYQLFLLIIAILYFSALGNFIYKNTIRFKDTIFAFVLYSALFYSFFSITGHRQTIATAVILYSFELIKKRKLIPFLLIILLASTIHKSALIFLPFYYISPIKYTRFFFWSIASIFPVLMLYRIQVTELLTNTGGEVYSVYGEYEGAGTYTFTAMLLLIALASWWRFKPTLRLNPQVQPFYNALLLAILFTPLTWVNPSAMRTVQYFSIFLLLLIPSVIQSFQNQSKKTEKFIYWILILSLVLLYIKSGWQHEYRFFWQDMKLDPNYLF
jgi:hypothetical protein